MKIFYLTVLTFIAIGLICLAVIIFLDLVKKKKPITEVKPEKHLSAYEQWIENQDYYYNVLKTTKSIGDDIFKIRVAVSKSSKKYIIGYSSMENMMEEVQKNNPIFYKEFTGSFDDCKKKINKLYSQANEIKSKMYLNDYENHQKENEILDYAIAKPLTVNGRPARVGDIISDNGSNTYIGAEFYGNMDGLKTITKHRNIIK